MQNIKKQAIEELANLMKTHQLSEIEYEENGTRIRVVAKREGPIPPVTPPVEPAVAPVLTTPAEPSLNKPAKTENNLVSPMVGIVYLSKAPNEPPFVKVGDFVKEGDTVCLIEAMKTFNPIKATKSGKISAVLVESGSPVEYNQPLFTLE